MSAFTAPAPKGQPPYWIREDDFAAMAEYRERLRKLEYIQSMRGVAKHAPNPLSRTWHD